MQGMPMAPGHVAGSSPGSDTSNESNAHPIVCSLRGGLSESLVGFLPVLFETPKQGWCLLPRLSIVHTAAPSLTGQEGARCVQAAPREAASLDRPLASQGTACGPEVSCLTCLGPLGRPVSRVFILRLEPCLQKGTCCQQTEGEPGDVAEGWGQGRDPCA